jgi:isoaspartyl peptidase/L-asparaginase-like protein (Ntn-hydrolase superfamily)
MEEDGRFNAGRGSVPTTDGSVEMDASVMDDTGRAGGVAGLEAHSAVAAAHAVWAVPRGGAPPGGRTILLAGPGAERFAAESRVPALTPLRIGRGIGATDPPPISSEGTVGAVAVTADGRFAAATSTGGRVGQPPGRVGDTPVPGAGVWAEPGCAVSATGAGEAFILAGFARLVATGHSSGQTLAESIGGALAEVRRYGGDGGGIALGRNRTWAGAFNTRAMARGVRHSGGRRVVVLG